MILMGRAFFMSEKVKRIIIAAVIVVVLAAACVTAFFLSAKKAVVGIVVNEDTELIETTTVEEFNEALKELIAEYDDELVVSGQQSTNRLMLVFEGEGIDLSAFPAATVIADEDNYVIIQFETEEEAQECLEALKKSNDIVFVEEDEYSYSIEDTVSSDEGGTYCAYETALADTAASCADTLLYADDDDTYSYVYTSSHTGFSYYSWGVEYMGLDVLAAWIMTQDTDSVTVAVLDSGIEVCDATQDRVLAGTDMIGDSDDGLYDGNGHGTHVSGTILDCTQGLDVYVMSVRVANDEGNASKSTIVSGLKYAIEAGVDVINISIGGGTDDDDAEDYYIEEAVENGIVVVVSAGNDHNDDESITTSDKCPAHIEECIVVAACDSTGTVAGFSTPGDSVDVCAPGVDILSYYLSGEMELKSGTSMAAPHVSALAAMLKLYLTDATPAQIEKYITDYCVDGGDEDFYGSGIPWAGYFAGD